MKPNPTQPNNVLHDTLESLSAKWLEAKEYEQQAIEYRRSLEEQMTATLGIDEAFEGSKTLTDTVTNARFGVMPSWAFAPEGGEPRLSEAEIRAVASYVHRLGGGE